MKNRIICSLLAVAMLLSLLSGAPIVAYAEEEKPTSEPTQPEETNPEETLPEEEPTDPMEPSDPSEPSDSTEPTDSSEVTEPSEETQPTETTVPPAPTEPTEPPPMTSSDDFIEVLKKMEGFHGVAYWDYSQWTIGYGTKCPSDKVNYYTDANPLSKEEAETSTLKKVNTLLRLQIDVCAQSFETVSCT